MAFNPMKNAAPYSSTCRNFTTSTRMDGEMSSFFWTLVAVVFDANRAPANSTPVMTSARTMSSDEMRKSPTSSAMFSITWPTAPVRPR